MRPTLQPLSIDYYTEAPYEELDFLKLEEQCIKRQRILNKIEDVMSKVKDQESENPHSEVSEELRPSIMELTEKEGAKFEKYSHWVLRLAYLGSKEQFVNLEGHLYKIRLELLTKANGLSDAQQAEELFTLIKEFYDRVNYPVEQIKFAETIFKPKSAAGKSNRMLSSQCRSGANPVDGYPDSVRGCC